MNTTTNYGLKKPEGTDIVNIEDLNYNADEIDAQLKNAENHAADAARHITAAERTTWNGKAETAVATTSANGLMSAADKTKLNGVATGANNYTHPTTSGNKHIPSGGTSGQILRWSADGTATWGADNNTMYSVATQEKDGLMSSLDKKKLDGVAANANNYVHPITAGNKHIPLGGASGQILKYSAAGTVDWAASATEISFTLTAAGWEGAEVPYAQTVSVSGLAAAAKGVVGLTTTATDEQYEAAAAAELAPSAIAANSITVKARGEKPTIDLPCVILIVG